MEVMRRFIIDLKPDGTMKWAEVVDPVPETNIDKRFALSAFYDLDESLKTYPKFCWPEEYKAMFLNGASEMLSRLGIKL